MFKFAGVLLCTGLSSRDLYCCDPALPWDIQPVRVWIWLKAVLPLFGMFAVAPGRCNNAEPRNMRWYRQCIDLCLYFCMGSWCHVLLIISANVISPFFSLKQCILMNILLSFYWDDTGPSALGQVKARHRKATRHHLKQCRTTDAYMRHRASVC